MKAWRRWSPWRLRSELRFLVRVLADDRASFSDDYTNTLIVRLWIHSAATLRGDAEPWTQAMKYEVRGRTLYIDATVHGSRWERVERLRARVRFVDRHVPPPLLPADEEMGL